VRGLWNEKRFMEKAGSPEFTKPVKTTAVRRFSRKRLAFSAPLRIQSRPARELAGQRANRLTFEDPRPFRESRTPRRHPSRKKHAVPMIATSLSTTHGQRKISGEPARRRRGDRLPRCHVGPIRKSDAHYVGPADTRGRPPPRCDPHAMGFPPIEWFRASFRSCEESCR